MPMIPTIVLDAVQGACRREREEDTPCPSWLAEQDAKAFLGEMVIVRQDVREALAAHDVHGDAIREAVLLIETRFVERQAIQKQRLGGRQDLDAGVLEDLTGFCRCALAGDLPAAL